MTVEKLIELLIDLPDHSIPVRISIKGGAEVDITDVDWIKHFQTNEIYALINDYPHGD
jgi:hypothetical protein